MANANSLVVQVKAAADAVGAYVTLEIFNSGGLQRAFNTSQFNIANGTADADWQRTNITSKAATFSCGLKLENLTRADIAKVFSLIDAGETFDLRYLPDGAGTGNTSFHMPVKVTGFSTTGGVDADQEMTVDFASDGAITRTVL